MHELSIALSIVDVAAEEAQRRGLGRSAAVHLRLGPLSGVVKDALLSAYDLAREGTELAAANLVIEEVPLVTFCPCCGGPRTLASPQLLCCPECGTATPKVVSGRELEVVALEVES
jgi:hydrogenase nickel incorporation protein HypA/HybF